MKKGDQVVLRRKRDISPLQSYTGWPLKDFMT